ncbi:hypothetical protein FBU59_002185 [Linderina macrospora]|uniref:Uncharacterized protein n=1 Tax=Linderina macrospora TaxID=4868 RepID=A0ACC1JBQ5_9FUNG|nr:hypothetical protein FBU59_002185 [Linderina macrospora]
MRVVPCVSSNSKLPTFHHLLPLSSTDTCFIGVSDGNVISTLAIDLSSQCHIRTLPVGDEPRRILADRDTGLLVVAGVQWQAQDSSSFPTSSLKVLDPRDGTVHAESRLQKNEVVYALTHWHVHGRKPYCFVCVGTGMYSAAGVPTPDSTKGGRIVIYSLKTLKRRRPGAKASPISSAASSPRLVPQPDTSSSYELKFRWESARNGPVTALAQLGDSYLVVGAGMSCIVLQLDMERGRLIECCEVMLRFPVTSVHVNGYQIAVGSQRESVHLFEFTPGDTRDALEMTSSARFGLQTADARFLSDRLVVGADRSGFLFAMPNGSDNSDEFAVDYKMGFHLGSVCTRVLSGRLVTYLHRSEHIVPWRADTSKRSDVVLASTVTGTLWSVVRITGQAFDLLQLLQEAVLALHYMHPAFPLLAGSRSICRVTRPAHNLKHQNVVDGELSTMFLDTLTEDEQRQVVASSTELRSKALLMCDASPLPDELSQNAAAVRAICTLIQGLNRACIY